MFGLDEIIGRKLRLVVQIARFIGRHLHFVVHHRRPVTLQAFLQCQVGHVEVDFLLSGGIEEMTLLEEMPVSLERLFPVEALHALQGLRVDPGGLLLMGDDLLTDRSGLTELVRAVGGLFFHDLSFRGGAKEPRCGQAQQDEDDGPALAEEKAIGPGAHRGLPLPFAARSWRGENRSPDRSARAHGFFR